MGDLSFTPTGESFQLPTKEDYSKEFERLKALVESQEALGREIVVVMGLGFVGAVTAAVIADAKDRKGIPTSLSLVCRGQAPGVIG